jgi:hypothetical protein
MDGGRNLLQDRLQIAQNLLIGESEDHVILASKVSVADLIDGALLLVLVDLSINLDDDSSIAAAEVRDEGADGVLAKELQPVELPATQPPPQESLCWRQIPPKLSRPSWVRAHPQSPLQRAFHILLPFPSLLSFSPSPGEGGREGTGEGAGG